ncbi:hypothetical protein Tmar_0911 [Thermaerobacter marianensis DSM 12885]|uniref:DUF402 domain-containing protein n=1 Tax=Thermaerobacter marianensis (strain ATCC 700841 / DSM 12885 / JCM 10246 / 7p75a) TaxID=644966 RepID=E6SJ97_THEM7|nr:DUF402 domain-containing protein [Thermaerobacter marianensis]ADU51025.1 hypothetical protein Tmar_0911 [Thermaerobacter marianensis DSM 12885]
MNPSPLPGAGGGSAGPEWPAVTGAPGLPPRPARRVQVEAWLATGRLKATWEGTLIEGPGWWCVAAEWSRGPVAAGPLTFEPGDRLLEVYWADRWYNVFRVARPGPPGGAGRPAPEGTGRGGKGRAGDERWGGGWGGAGWAGELKGYYVNLSTPARLVEPAAGGAGQPGGPPAPPGLRLVYVDGVLDAVIGPDGRWQWVDRDEFRQLVRAAGRSRWAHPAGAKAAAAGGPEPAGRRGTGSSGGGDPAAGMRGGAEGLPDAPAWVEAARRLAAALARGAGAFVAGLVPWDQLERRVRASRP